ncbi:glutaminase [Ameyamaea chiangmaiensis NBRC 103196]|uniref:Glutaminase n=1 Tax=Ameyamaea chiangmaiensis TaxID=442969 RepID=A0A850PBQ3_9PROT|nr:glutaminase [Ameyamaea chiangmaiensis]MBS4075978.1 glutaminase [Ameyamaea chiangmaiensis]NVN39736.1 glutaminase [Ameyamaea chiangmaiensis]GBQ61558.1 glutaminase [Ameyamaea chiangmaiensis NBRC 103196]
MTTDLAPILTAITAQLRRRRDRGVLPRYIAPLAAVDPRKFGLAVLEADGRMHLAGDAEEPFSIQSISKVHALTMALETVGSTLWTHVRQEPSGSAFNSITQLESEHGIPRNPFINAGAIVVTDQLITRLGRQQARHDFLAFMRSLTDDGASVRYDEAIARAEYDSGFRNVALANYMRTFGTVQNNTSAVLRQYFHQCALTMTCRQLAESGRFLMTGGRAPSRRGMAIASRTARTVAAVMMTCGHYDGSGSFAVRVGLPGKSGVGGGILAIVPGIASIAVWSPGLNEQGNSLLGTEALELLVEATGWSVLGRADAAATRPREAMHSAPPLPRRA